MIGRRYHVVSPLLALGLLMPMAACSSGTTAKSDTSIHAEYNKVIHSINSDEKQFQHGLANLVKEAKVSGKLPTRKRLASVLNPLYQGVSSSIVKLAELGVPKQAASDMRKLLAGLANVAADMREVVAAWPSTSAVPASQLKISVEKVAVFSILVGRDLAK